MGRGWEEGVFSRRISLCMTRFAACNKEIINLTWVVSASKSGKILKKMRIVFCCFFSPPVCDTKNSIREYLYKSTIRFVRNISLFGGF